MQKAINNILFNMELFSFEGKTNHVVMPAAFYQQIALKLIKVANGAGDWVALANWLIALADHALNLQQTDAVEQIGQILISAPLPHEYKNIGHFYQVFCLKRRGEKDQARAGFQQMAESLGLPLSFRARAVQALGAICFERGLNDEALRFSIEAAHLASTKKGNAPLAMFNAQLLIGICKSIDGDHHGALLQLENLLPIVRMLGPSQPLVHYLYINSLAVEFSELKRFEEAQRLAEITVRSPYANLHPEWHETKTEILEKMQRQRPSPSIVSNSAWPQAASPTALGFQLSSNVVAMPTVARPVVAPNTSAGPPQVAKIIDYYEWKQRLPEAVNGWPDKFTPGELQQLSIAHKQAALLEVIYGDDVTHDQLDHLLEAAGKVTTDVSIN